MGKKKKQKQKELQEAIDRVNESKAAKRKAILDGYKQRALNAGPGSLAPLLTKKQRRRLARVKKAESIPPKPLGERRLNENGYWLTPSGKLEHRVFYRKAFGKIPKGWHVHHVDQNKQNNSLDNLLAMPAKTHMRLHDLMWRSGALNRSEQEQFIENDIKFYMQLKAQLKEAEREQIDIALKVNRLKKAIKDY